MSNYTNSPNMNLPVPTVGVDPGPDYAINVNTSLTLIDQHDHTPGNGVQITPSGLNINDNLDMQSHSLLNSASLTLVAQNSTPSTLGTIYESGVDLYYIDGIGNNIRLTQNGSIAGASGAIAGLVSPASASYIPGTSTFVWQSNTSIAANMDFGAAILRNISPNSTFALTLQAPANLSSNYSVTLPTLPAQTSFLAMSSTGIITTPIATANLYPPDNAGTQGQFLRKSATTASTWTTPVAYMQTVTGNYTLLNSDDGVYASGAPITITLPASTKGKQFIIKKTDSSLTNIITIIPNGVETINGAATYILLTKNDCITIAGSNSGWDIVNHSYDTSWNTASTVGITATSAHIFVIASSSVTEGAIYSNNGINFTVSLTISSSTTLTCAGLGNPTTSGTLTKVSGTGPATIAFSSVTNSTPTKGTIVTDEILWRRIGDSAEIQLNIVTSTAGTVGNGDYLFDLSPVGSINSSILPYSTIPLGSALNNTSWSQWRWPASGLCNSSGGGVFGTVCDVVFYNPTLFKIEIAASSTGFLRSSSVAFSGSVGYQARFIVPIAGWNA